MSHFGHGCRSPLALAATASAPAWPPSWDALGELGQGGNRHSRVSLLLRERKRRRPSAPHRCLRHLAVPKPSRPRESGRRLALSLRTRGWSGVQHVLPPVHSRLGTRSAHTLLWEHQHPALSPVPGWGWLPLPAAAALAEASWALALEVSREDKVQRAGREDCPSQSPGRVASPSLSPPCLAVCSLG